MKFRAPGRSGHTSGHMGPGGKRNGVPDITRTWQALHRRMETVTPLVEDCGCLCGARCCAGGPEDGMLLFPGEETLYGPEDLPQGWTVRDSTLILPGFVSPVQLLVCNGHCVRSMRPMSCRIFPLLPRVDAKGRVHVAPDLRALSVCPLLSETAPLLRLSFLRAIQDVFGEAMLLPGVSELLKILNEENRMMEKFLR